MAGRALVFCISPLKPRVVSTECLAAAYVSILFSFFCFFFIIIFIIAQRVSCEPLCVMARAAAVLALLAAMAAMAHAAAAHDWRARTVYQLLTDRFSNPGASAPCGNLGSYCGGTFQVGSRHGAHVLLQRILRCFLTRFLPVFFFVHIFIIEYCLFF